MNKTILYYDLREESRARRLPFVIGRQEEIARMDRAASQRVNNNILIVGENGIGKTALVYGWIRHVISRQLLSKYALLQFDSEHLFALSGDTSLDEHFAEALACIPSSVVFVDDVGREVCRGSALSQRIHHLYKGLLVRPDVHVVMTFAPHEYAWLEREHPAFVRHFEIINLKTLNAFEHGRVLLHKMPRVRGKRNVIVFDQTLRHIVRAVERFPILGTMPRAGIHLLDEGISSSLARGEKLMRPDSIDHIVEEKTGVPRARLSENDIERMRGLSGALRKRIVGQDRAIERVAATLQRGSLGLRNPDRPLGSFLLLGPSGVGKTETAKTIAELVFGRPRSFVRFDMSEFQQEHTMQRLIGAPPGYIGFEEGGALTNALRKEPYSLVLFDEIEKAHPKVFDLFLQLLDDGRLTSGQNETIDARHAIFMATSNVAVAEIISAHENGATIDSENFFKERLLPVLMKTFRLEFINRFDNVLVFKPLSQGALLRIAELELKKLEKRLETHRVRFTLEPNTFTKKVSELADPRFGARPVKRFIEETCELLVAQSLLHASV